MLNQGLITSCGSTKATFILTLKLRIQVYTDREENMNK
jgi:hypothetical protein